MKFDRPILITGASGLLGGMCLWRWRNQASKLAALVRDASRFPQGAWPGVQVVAGDLSQPESLGAAVETVRPAWVLHGAALTNVDACQENPAEARALNAEASGVLARECRKAEADLCYISTDSVYARGEGPHAESGQGGELSTYAASKLAGEQAVLAEHPRALVIRTCMFGWNQNPARSSLAEWMVTTLQKGEEVPGFEDVYFSPLFTAHLTGYLLQAMEKDLQGVYNVGSSGGLSKFEFGRLLALGMGLNPDLVRPVSQSQARLAAPRPASPVMDSSRFYQALGTAAPEVKEEITSFWEWRRGDKLRDFRRFGGYA